MSEDLIPYGAESAIVPTHETSTAATAAMARAQIEARCVMAMRNPRDIAKAREMLLADCKRLRFAETATYAVPRGGKTIVGPSIRFAEAALRALRNVAVETAIVFDDATKRIVRVTVVDLEANLPYMADIAVPKTMERKKLRDGQKSIAERINSYGEKVYVVDAPDDEVAVKQAALVSKTLRTLALRLLPGDLLEEAMDVVYDTVTAGDAADPSAARKKLADAFLSVGVKADQLAQYLGHGVDAVTPAEMKHLRGVYAALKDGETTWSDVMEAGLPTGNGKPTAPVESPDERLKVLQEFAKVRAQKPKAIAEALNAAGIDPELKSELIQSPKLREVLAAIQNPTTQEKTK